MISPFQRLVLAPLAALSLLFPAVTLAASSAISIGSVSPGTATTGVPTLLSASVSSSAGSITSCNLYIDNDDKGAMTVTGGTAKLSHTFQSAQIYTAFVFCRDSAGNFNSGPNASVWAKGTGGGSGSDITPPAIGLVFPPSAVAGTPVTLSATVSDASGIPSCTLFVSNQSQGAMTITGGVASKQHTFSAAGVYTAYVQCADTSANTGTGSNTAVTVTPAVAQSPETPNAPSGSLIKLTCPAEAEVDHPCKAVYYHGKDGKRHAFPNEKIYFTWYVNFDSVATLSSEAMAAIPLGKNVTYRPGSRMVKFPTVPSVYVISKGGALRWVKTEAEASAIYGPGWSKNVDDLSEAFFLDYHYGEDVAPLAPFDVAFELQGANTIDDTL